MSCKAVLSQHVLQLGTALKSVKRCQGLYQHATTVDGLAC